MKTRAALIFLIAFTAFGSLAYGQAHRMGNTRTGMPEGRMELGHQREGAGAQFYLNMRERLGLGEDQVKELQGMRLEYVKQVSDLESRLKVARLELADLTANNGKQGDIEQKIRQVYELEGSIAVEHSRARSEARAVLTDDQRQQLEAGPRQMPAGPNQGQQGPDGGRGMMHAPGMPAAPR